MSHTALNYPYSSRRMAIFATNGMVATSQPLAAQAGLRVLEEGGNAIDAAVAAAASLTVLEPASNGIGGDAFALIWSGGKLHGLNASGPAPQKLTAEAVRQAGYENMPRYGWLPVTVPGAPAAWAAASQRFGKLPLTKVLEPAIQYAEQGYPISPILGVQWRRAFEALKKQAPEELYREWFATFAPHDRAPEIGEIWRSPNHASTLQKIADTNAESFYRGELAEKIDHFSRTTGGAIRGEDLAAYQPEWVDPIKINYRGYDIWEIPPNGQGLVVLMALNILKKFDFTERDTLKTLHKQIEALKLAFVDGKHFITDPHKMGVTVEDLLSDAYAEERRKQIGTHACLPTAGKPQAGGTVYIATADREGNMVSFIQSNYMGFGSGLVVPGTGISLQNRGHTFSLDPEHYNYLEPGKRTYHTIIPGFITKDDHPVGPFGVMGGFMQPQGHLQVVMNTIDFQMNPQAALDAPRWQWIEGKKIWVEHTFPNHLAQSLAEKGHDIEVKLDSLSFGRGQIIQRNSSGVLIGGTEPRCDGGIAAF